MQEWFTARELAEMDLPGLSDGRTEDPDSRKRSINRIAKRECWHKRRTVTGTPLSRTRRGEKGGPVEYHYSVLPTRAQAHLVTEDLKATKAAAKKPEIRGVGERWAIYERMPEKKKTTARYRLAILESVLNLTRVGQPKNVAIDTIVRREKAEGNRVSVRSVYDWFGLVAGIERADWLPFLAPQHRGKTGARAEMSPEAWEYFKADYLRQGPVRAEACYRRLQRMAKAEDWSFPTLRTLMRRLESEVPVEVRTLLRKGEEELARLYPYQERDRSHYHALQAVNADGHKADVLVRWPDGEVARPHIVVIQDLYSNKILAWRVDKSLTSTAVRLAFYDVFRDFGIPEVAYFDNGREFAAKLITGGTETRYRFKVKDDDPVGILPALGVEIHWTTPYHGQAKPIERAFRDWAGDMALDPAFDGAYTGNTPSNKPENYGSKPAPLDTFLSILGQYIAAENARAGRRTRTCRGVESFDGAFAESYSRSLIKRAGPEQLRMAMLAADEVTARKPDGSVWVLDNRFWGEFLTRHIGEKLIVRFDPENTQAGAHIYRRDQVYLGFAECLEAVGFDNVDAARAHTKARREFIKHTKAAAKAEVRLTPADVAAAMPPILPEEAPEPPKITRLVAGGGGRPMPVSQPVLDEDSETVSEFRSALSRGLTLVAERQDL